MDDYSKGKDPQPSMEARGLAKNEPWQVQVDVYLEDDSTDPPKFRVESCLPHKIRDFKGKDEKYLVFHNNHRPGFRILFQLHDLTAGGAYRFPKVARDAVWSKIGDECPRKGSWEKSEVFNVERVSNETLLVVRFENERIIGDFRYTLNVTKTGDQPYLELDPGGTGMNGQPIFR